MNNNFISLNKYSKYMLSVIVIVIITGSFIFLLKALIDKLITD